MENLATNVYNENTDIKIQNELNQAGICAVNLHAPLMTNVKTRIIGELFGFKFYRAWSYWVVENNTIPCKKAQSLFTQTPDFFEIYAYGDPSNIYPNTDVNLYHINTLEGLWFFATFLKNNMISPTDWTDLPLIKSYLQQDNCSDFVGQIIDIFEDYLITQKETITLCENNDDTDVESILNDEFYNFIYSPVQHVIDKYHLLQGIITSQEIMNQITQSIVDGFNEMLINHPIQDTRTDYMKVTHEQILKLQIENTFLKWRIYQ